MTREASPALGSIQTAPGWKSKTHKRYISKDRVLLKQLEVACKGNEQTRELYHRLKCKMLRKMCRTRLVFSPPTALLFTNKRFSCTLNKIPANIDTLASRGHQRTEHWKYTHETL